MVTNAFDYTVVIFNPKKTFEDKLTCFRQSPFEETIFIDADCLIYGDIDSLFDDLTKSNSFFSCYGQSWNLSAQGTNSWFSPEGIPEYQDRIHCLIDLHGGVYYFQKGKFLDDFCELIKELLEKYSSFEFRMFTGIPADEPIVALAMAIYGLCPIDFNYRRIIFFPWISEVLLKPMNGEFYFSSSRLGLNNVQGTILHWGHANTLGQEYKYNADIFRARINKNGYIKAICSRWLRRLYGHINGISIRLLKKGKK